MDKCFLLAAGAVLLASCGAPTPSPVTSCALPPMAAPSCYPSSCANIDTCSRDPRIAACHRLPASAPSVVTLALATNDSEIGVAWVENTIAPMWHFTLFRPDATMISDTPCLGDAAMGLSVIAVPTGWLVAAATTLGTVELTGLDAQGVVSWRLRADGTSAEPIALGVVGPQLIAGPGGTGLVGWQVRRVGQAQSTPLTLRLLAGPFGQPTGDLVTVPDVADWAGVGVGDGYALAADLSPGTPDMRLQLFHLAPDGTLAMGSSVDTKYFQSRGVSLAWNGSDLQMIYAGAYQSLLQRATGDGTLTGDPQQIDSNAPSAAPLFAVGTETIVLHDGVLDRWTDAGPSPGWSALTVVEALSFPTVTALGEQNGDAIVAWGNESIPLSVARVRLAP
jgi:hypothetical protein